MDEHMLNDLLECSVCLERLDTSSKVLPCQHTFCRKCLEVIVSSRHELRCPECRVLVNLKIEDLPPNVLLMRILEGMKNSATVKAQQQQSCLKNKQKSDDGTSYKDTEQEQNQQHLHFHHQQHKNKQKYSMQEQTQQQKQHQQRHLNSQHRCLAPHVCALYDFDSKEPSDLNFKKGDVIFLKRKVDTNWYVGHFNGFEGTFPINYVQIIVPLETPQCVALYDFKMGPNEEDGCLTFKKDTLIHVLRRVDTNWAEGRIGSSIGIFPIAFVEFNTLAQQLLNNSISNVSSSTQSATDSADNNIQDKQQQNLQQGSEFKSTINQQQHQSRNLPPLPIIDPTINYSPSSESSSSTCSNATKSPNSITTTTSISSSSNSMANSPNQSLPNTPQHLSSSIRLRDCTEKRHFLNSLTSAGASSALSINSSNRHSDEVLSILSSGTNMMTSTSLVNSANWHVHTRIDDKATSASLIEASNLNKSVLMSPNNSPRQQQPSTAPHSENLIRVNALKTSCGQQNTPPTLPWSYLALYPYKPCKIDELELKKGCVYIVTEHCLDGWFKGKNWQDICGVFPGNYVVPLRARDQQQLMRQWKYVQLSSTVSPTAPTIIIDTNHPQMSHMDNIPNGLNKAGYPHPPDLPLRQFDNGTSSPSLTLLGCASVWTKPLGYTVDAFNRSGINNTQRSTIENTLDRDAKERDLKHTYQSNLAQSAAVTLTKRLSHIKSRSKSKNLPSFNATDVLGHSPTQHEAAATPTPTSISSQWYKHNKITNSAMHPVHVRSGSCPSKLLQNFPMDVTTSAAGGTNKSIVNQTQQQKQQLQFNCNSSQKFKGDQEQTQLQNFNSRQQQDSTTYHSVYCNEVLQQKQQHHEHPINVNTSIIGNQQGQHCKSQSLDAANTVITPLLPLLPQHTIQTTATTPSTTIIANTTNNTTTNSIPSHTCESRFRCVVPYPPNSDIELELHVGDIIYVHRKQRNGWYKGTHAHTHKTGLFPASFVVPDI